MIRSLMRRIRGLKVDHPEKVTLGDCILADQMGYETIIGDSQVKGFRRKKR